MKLKLAIRFIPVALMLMAFTVHAGAPVTTGKLDKRLAAIAAAVAKRRAAPVMARALTRQLFRQNSPLSVRWNASGQVQVYLHFYHIGESLDMAPLAALGATDIVVSQELGVVQAWIPADKLAAAAELSGITRISVPHYAVVKRAPNSTGQPRTGSVDTQGDQILGAALYRQLTGFNGQGIAVGVISDGDNSIASSQSTGDLPATIWNDPNDASSFKSSGDEGTAMMEIVYDLAPGVQLGFCGPQTTVDFITCLNDFVSHFGSNLVIVDDLGFPGVAMFTDGAYATAVQNFSIANPAVRLVTAGGNDAEGFWAGDWNPLALPNAGVNNGNPVKINGISYSQIQNFGTASAPLTRMAVAMDPNDTLSWLVQWGDAWQDSVNGLPPTGVPNDPNNYDVILVDGSGNVLACNIGENIGTAANPPSPSSCNYSTTLPTNTPGPQPIQGTTWTNNTGAATTVYLEILYAPGDGTPDTHLKVLAMLANAQINVVPGTPAGSIYGQSALPYPYEITVGAVSAQNNPNYQIESYSSQGPVFLFQPATGSSTRMKPDFVGVDGVSITGAGGFENPFYGTSAAAPHIAGLIALLESGFPSNDPYQLLKAGALALGTGDPNGVYGYGLPNAARSVGSKYPSPTASISSPAGSVAINAGQSISFSGSCSVNGAPGTVSYNWDFGASSGIPSSSSANPTVTFQFFGQYTVTLTCTNEFGVRNATPATVNVTVKAVNSNPTGGSGGGGGGGLGLMALSALLFLQVAALYRKH
jgi:hypothetical protein